jgi:Zn-dependent M28 family amino/carboxypeptidase
VFTGHHAAARRRPRAPLRRRQRRRHRARTTPDAPRRGRAYTAHYDHLGIGTPVDGDSIYNGAYDNASGVALLLQVAEAFAACRTRPERSILFLFTTAEEAGMLGASWYVRQPLVPLQRTVAALNIDGANLWGETDDISAVGLERSTLGSVFEAQAAVIGLRVEGERAPGKGFYFRSDHFPFARAGVPALYLDHGTEFRNQTARLGRDRAPALRGRALSPAGRRSTRRRWICAAPCSRAITRSCSASISPPRKASTLALA